MFASVGEKYELNGSEVGCVHDGLCVVPMPWTSMFGIAWSKVRLNLSLSLSAEVIATGLIRVGPFVPGSTPSLNHGVFSRASSARLKSSDHSRPRPYSQASVPPVFEMKVAA